ncbi:hypothetical protein AB0O67_18550 [Streptomyces sp. NPDC086077]
MSMIGEYLRVTAAELDRAIQNAEEGAVVVRQPPTGLDNKEPPGR